MPNDKEKLRKALSNIGSKSDREPNANGKAASFVCGSSIEIGFTVENGAITDGRSRSNGCTFLVGAANVLIEHLKGRSLTGLGSLNSDMLILVAEQELGGFGDRKDCLELAVEAIRGAFRDLRESQIAEFSGETALICSCFGISEEKVIEIVEKNSVETVDRLAEYCGAGSGCGSCQQLIQEIIDGNRAERL